MLPCNVNMLEGFIGQLIVQSWFDLFGVTGRISKAVSICHRGYVEAVAIKSELLT